MVKICIARLDRLYSTENTHTGHNNTRHSAKINIFSLPPNNQTIYFFSFRTENDDAELM